MNDITTLKSRMDAIGSAILDLQAAFKHAYDDLDNLSAGDPSLKDEFGKLTQAGKQRMKDMFRDGVSNADIATFFKISPSAVSYRRNTV